MKKTFGSGRFDTIGILTTCRPTGINILQGEKGFISSNGLITDATDALLFLNQIMKNFLNGNGILHILGVKVTRKVLY